MLPITRHHQYYLPGRDLYILIGNILFCIHKYFFKQESKTFFTQHYMDPNADVPYGDYAAHPLIIHNVEVIEFKQFLWVFYNPCLSIYETSITNWNCIIHLAVLWGFDEVCALATRKVYKLEEPFQQQQALVHAWSPEDPTNCAMHLHFEDDHGI